MKVAQHEGERGNFVGFLVKLVAQFLLVDIR